MGTGTVSADGKSIVSDPGVGIPKFCCGASFPQRNAAGNTTGGNGGNGCGPTSANPVDLSSGNNLAMRMRPFGIDGLMPAQFSCQYRSTDPRVGYFGLGVSFRYDWFAEPLGDAIRVTSSSGVQYLLSKGVDGNYRATEGRDAALGWTVSPTANGRTLHFAQGGEFEFNQPGQLVAVRDINGNRLTITRDGNGYATAITDGNGKSYTFERKTVTIGRTVFTLATKITDSLGRSIAFTYDAAARMTSHTDAAGHVTSYAYDANGRIAKRTDPEGGVLQFAYDAGGRTIQEVLEDGTSTVRYDYVALGSVVAQTTVTDPNGSATVWRFNGRGYPARMIDPMGRVTMWNRDYARNLVQSVTDPAGRVTRYTYDANGNMTSVRDPLGNLTLIDVHPILNKPIKVTNALGFSTTYDYDSQGNLTTVTDGEGGIERIGYSAIGQAETLIDPLGRVSRIRHDAQGNQTASQDPLGHGVTSTFDAANRLKDVTDALGIRAVSLGYDDLDRVVQATDANTGQTAFAYDGLDRLTQVTDALGHVVEHNVYDLRGRLTQRTEASNQSTRHEYDAAGNLTTLTDRKGQATRFAYDAANRLIRREDADGRITSVEYDLAGNIAAMRDNRSGDLILTYDELNHLTRVVSDQGTVDYAYDAIGRRTQRLINGADSTDYSYDKANRLARIDYRGRSTQFQYDAAGRLIRKTLPNGLVQAYQYDDGDRLTQIQTTRSDGSVLDTTSYDYDANGQRTSKGAAMAGVPETPLEASYDAANRLTQVTLNGIAYALSYDANGNLSRKQGPDETTTYTWDAGNRLVQIDTPTATANFKYDALGRRIERTVNGETTQFLYDGVQAIAEIRNSAIETTILTGLEADDVIARYTGQAERSLLTDALGSVIAATKEDQSSASAYGYSSYGETQTAGTDEGNPIQYTARENDGTGLYYYRARYYDPQLKRFIAEDPIGLAGGIDKYTYVGGSPASYVDPNGEFVWVPAAAAIGAVIGGAINFAQTLNDPCFNGSATTLLRNTAVGAGLGLVSGAALGTGVPAIWGVTGGVALGGVTGALNAWGTGGSGGAIATQAIIGGVAGGIGGAYGLVSAQAAYWAQLPVTMAGRQAALQAGIQVGNTSASIFSSSANAISNLITPSNLGGLNPGGSAQKSCPCGG